MGTTSKIAKINQSQEELFDTVLENLKPFGYGKGKKIIMCSGSVPLSLLFVDSRYQGMRKHKQLSRLRIKWDIRKLTPIILVPHFEENRFAIVDGQGRFLIASELKYGSLQAIVLMDIPKNIDERLKFEAEYFIGQDSEAESVRPLEKHPARVIIGDAAALTVQKLLEKYKITFTGERGNREQSVLGSYTDTYAIAKVHGEKCLDFIFSIIENAGWNHETNGYATFVMRALREIWVAHPNDRAEIHTYLSEELRQLDPALFSSIGRSRYPKREHRAACVLYAEDLVCKGLYLERKIYADDKKVKILK